MRKTRFISLKLKITFLSIFLVLFCTGSIGGYILFNLPSIVINSAGRDYINILKSISDSLDKDKLADIKSADIGSEYHIELNSELEYIKGILGLEHLYLLKQNDKGGFFELAGNNSDTDAVSSATIAPNTETQIITPAMEKSFNGIESFELLKDSRWGQLFSIYLPVINNGKTIGVLVANLKGDAIFNEFSNVRLRIMIIACAILLIGIIIAILFSILLVASLKKLQKHVEKLQEGNLSIRVSKHPNDEIGLLGRSFNKLSDTFAGIVGDIKDKSVKLNNTSGQLSVISNNIAMASEETVCSVSEIAKGASQQAQELMEISEILHNFNETVKQFYSSLSDIKGNVELSDSLSKEGNDQLQKLISSIRSAMESFNAVSERITELSADMQQIDEINQAIQGISKQTNLLALNAAIEAARAGESGKGFSVVADEIRKLAEQSKDSTDKIRHIIDGVLSRVENVVVTSDDVKEKFSNQFEFIDNTNNAFKSIVNSLEETLPTLEKTFDKADAMIKGKDTIIEKIEFITAVSQQTSAGTQEILNSTEAISNTAKDIATTSKTLQHLSEELTEEINIFTL